ncbi:MAG TPA: GspH/FimT family pseudopilin [Usitatibacteraceae bacterium]|nr:GspH/FimT family pseudopilin [Usitatibacteraceae bacterium]
MTLNRLRECFRQRALRAPDGAGARAASGFTLLEVMIVLAVVGILAAVAVPNFSAFVKSSRLRSATSGLYEAMVLARSEAIKRGANVTVSPTGGEWGKGWSVVVGGTTLQRWDPEAGVSFDDATPGDIVYGLNGRIGGTREIVTYISGEATVAARCVNIDVSGRVNTKVDTDGNKSNGC